MQDHFGTNVAVATLAFLCYRLLFHSKREASITALIFCAACAWCVGQMAAAAAGAQIASTPYFTFAAETARSVCSNVLFSISARETCWNYTSYFMPKEPD